MALREVTAEITARYIVKFTASSSDEAAKKAREFEIYCLEPDYRDEVILDVQPINNQQGDNTNEDAGHHR